MTNAQSAYLSPDEADRIREFMRQDLQEARRNAKKFEFGALTPEQQKLLHDYLTIADLQKMPVFSSGDYADCVYDDGKAIVLWHRTTRLDRDYFDNKVEVKFLKLDREFNPSWLLVKVYQPR
jgi:hypothetical protein